LIVAYPHPPNASLYCLPQLLHLYSVRFQRIRSANMPQSQEIYSIKTPSALLATSIFHNNYS
ncbi:hypothetical protein ACFJZM_12990, partial [Enterococcus faecalis]